MQVRSQCMLGNGDDPLDDDDFPLGDGTADTAATVLCPYCGEENEIGVDPSGGDSQDYIEDCQVCCRPWHVFVSFDENGAADVHLDPADDA
ncbi:MAG TPA: CPXCG motif-containing cysteine-rich protein [Gemmatimonadaceae bacterium]|nr:CPXCG motif-containing cysteine-rich protein [Gemmatimonadaceae bacterium]